MSLVIKKLAKESNRNSNEIDIFDQLREEPLHYDAEEIRGLSSCLNDIFIAHNLDLTPHLTGPAMTVLDLITIVWTNIPEENRDKES